MSARFLPQAPVFAAAVALFAGALVAAPAASFAVEVDTEDLGRPPAKQGGGDGDVALIVATSKYAHLPRLPGVDKVVDAWKTHLEQVRGVPAARIVTLEATDGAAVRAAAAQLGATAGAGGIAWLIAIGHGTPGKAGAEPVLVDINTPSDTKDAGGNAIPVGPLAAVLGGKAGAVVAVVDTGYTDKKGRVWEWVGSLAGKGGLGVAASKTAMLVATDTDGGAALLPKLRRPAFGWLMLAMFRGWPDHNRDKKVTAGEAHLYAATALSAAVLSGQKPVLSGKGAATVVATNVQGAPDDGDEWLTRLNASYSELSFAKGQPLLPPRTKIPKTPAVVGIIAGLAGFSALQDLRKVHSDPAASPDDKAQAWCKVARGGGALIPYGKLAERGCDLWKRYAAKHMQQRGAFARQYDKLKAYLGKPGANTGQKIAAISAFLVVYGIMGKDERIKELRALRKQLLGQAAKEKKSPSLPAEDKSGTPCDGNKAAGCLAKAKALAGKEGRESEMCSLLRYACDELAEACTLAGRCYEYGVGVAINAGKAADFYRKGCAGRHGEGCGWLGLLQDLGAGVPREDEAAANNYGKACGLKVAWACTSLGVLTLHGRAGKVDGEAALALMTKGCEGGDAAGCFDAALVTGALKAGAAGRSASAALLGKACGLGHGLACLQYAERLRAGDGVTRDEKAAEALLNKSCKGDRDSAACIGKLQVQADGATGGKTGKNAVAKLQKLCDAGVLVACSAVAGLYRRGQVVERDRAQAGVLYGRVCAAGVGSACDQLCATYTEEGVERTKLATVAKVCEARCDSGSSDACAAVGRILQEGGSGSAPQAFRRYTAACDDGSGLGCLLLARMLRTGVGAVQKSTSEAVRRYEQGCDAGSAKACAGLAGMLLRGEGGTGGAARAATLLQRACAQREGAACGVLAAMYAQGSGVGEDAKEAARLRARACLCGHGKSCLR